MAVGWGDDVSEVGASPPNICLYISGGRFFPFLTEEENPPPTNFFRARPGAEVTRKSNPREGWISLSRLSPPEKQGLTE